jgi:hypothetical protein
MALFAMNRARPLGLPLTLWNMYLLRKVRAAISIRNSTEF